MTSNRTFLRRVVTDNETYRVYAIGSKVQLCDARDNPICYRPSWEKLKAHMIEKGMATAEELI